MNELSNIAKTANNDLIVWTIVIIIGLVICIPLFKLLLNSMKDKRAYEAQCEEERRKADSKREELLINVVKDNTIAITGLTTSIKIIMDQQSYDLREISKREEQNSMVINEIYNILLNKEEKK